MWYIFRYREKDEAVNPVINLTWLSLGNGGGGKEKTSKHKGNLNTSVYNGVLEKERKRERGKERGRRRGERGRKKLFLTNRKKH